MKLSLFIYYTFIDVSVARNCVSAGVPIKNLHNFSKTPDKNSLGVGQIIPGFFDSLQKDTSGKQWNIICC